MGPSVGRPRLIGRGCPAAPRCAGASWTRTTCGAALRRRVLDADNLPPPPAATSRGNLSPSEVGELPHPASGDLARQLAPHTLAPS